MASAVDAGAMRTVPQIAAKTDDRRMLTLVYDKLLGIMRAVEGLVL